MRTYVHILLALAVLAALATSTACAQSHQVIVSNAHGVCVLLNQSSEPFAEHIVDASFGAATSVRSADVDGDGDADILGAAASAADITWWENVDGDGSNWTEHTVATSFDGARSVCGTDIDGDGDVDLVGAAYYDDVLWWENVGGAGTNWSTHILSTDGDGARSVYATDLDGDGDTDVLAASYYTDDITWWQNTDGVGGSWLKHSIDNDFSSPHCVHAADVDGDGDMDVLGAAYYDDDITWWENCNGAGTSWTEHSVDANFDGARSIHAVDIDGDGDIDVAGASYHDDDIAWWENTDGKGTNWAEHTAANNFDGAYAVACMDVDGDGDIDLLGAAYYGDSITWWENTDGKGTNWAPHVLNDDLDGASSVHGADIDGDGNVDVLGAAYFVNKIGWWRNTLDDRTVFTPPAATNDIAYTPTARCFVTNSHIVSGTTQYVCTGWTRTGIAPVSGAGADTGSFSLTNDTSITWTWTKRYLLAVSTVSNGTVTDGSGWYEPGTNVTIAAEPGIGYYFAGWTGEVPAEQSTKNPLTVKMSQPRQISATFARYDHTITAAAGAHGTISPSGIVGVMLGHNAKFMITADAHYYISDLSVNGESVGAPDSYTFNSVVTDHTISASFAIDTFDIAVTNIHSSSIVVRQAGVAFLAHTVDGGVSGAGGIRATDLDGDGNMDMLAVSTYTDDVIWWQNNGGSGTNWIKRIVDPDFDGAYSVHPADIDGDDDIDILGTALYADEIVWWQNNDGTGTDLTKHTVADNLDAACAGYAADLDNDGDMDVIGVGWYANYIGWWENIDGTGTNWTAHTVRISFDGAFSVHVADVDADGDTDILGTTYDAGEVAWWENVDGKGTNWREHTVAPFFAGALSVHSADLDGDGDVDVLGAAYNSDDITWWENTDGKGTNWSTHTVDDNFDGARSVYATDLDKDGDMDVLGAAAYDDDITWWENADGKGTNWREHIVDGAFDGARSVYAADIDGDGEMDVLGAAMNSGDIAWWQNTTEDRTTFSPEHTTGTLAYSASTRCFLTNAVTPNDTTQYVCTGWTGTGSAPASGTGTDTGTFELTNATSITWHWRNRYRLEINAQSNGTVDTESDWHNDGTNVTITAEPTARYYRFAGWTGDVPDSKTHDNPLTVTMDQARTIAATFAIPTFAVTVTNEYGRCDVVRESSAAFVKHTVDGSFARARSVYASDLDADGDMDVLGASELGNDVTWWENTDGKATNWTEHTIAGNFYGARTIRSADVNGDGNMDVLAAAYYGDKIAWWENADGKGTLWSMRTVSGGIDGACSIHVSDIDNDGDMDVLGAADVADTIILWANADDVGTRWVERGVLTNFDGASSVYTADIDGDGDVDILGAARNAGHIAWCENVNGSGRIWATHTVSTNVAGASDVSAADMDRDGDIDILGTAADSAAIYWWENIDGTGTNWAAHTVDDLFRGAAEVHAIDIDRDGDVDILGAASLADDITWWENSDGSAGTWRKHTVEDFFDGAGSTYAADLDTDGEIDILGAAYSAYDIAWWKNGAESRKAFSVPVAINTTAESDSARSFVTNSPLVNGTTQYVCTGWIRTGSSPDSGPGADTGPFPLTNDTAITWHWKIQYRLETSAGPHGVVNIDNGWYDAGTSLVATAVPDTGYSFIGWTGNVSAAKTNENPLSLTMDQAHTLTAAFAKFYQIVAVAGANGTITPSGTVLVIETGTKSFSIVPVDAYCVSNVVVDGSTVSARTNHTFMAVRTNHSIAALFEIQTAETDSDHDGLTNEQEAQYGTGLYVTDSDGDGLTDYQEVIITGTSPTNNGSGFLLTLTQPPVGDRTKIGLNWETVTGRQYTIWSRPHMLTGTWGKIAGYTNMPGTGAAISYTNTTGDAVRYFRSTVKKPE